MRVGGYVRWVIVRHPVVAIGLLAMMALACTDLFWAWVTLGPLGPFYEPELYRALESLWR